VPDGQRTIGFLEVDGPEDEEPAPFATGQKELHWLHRSSDQSLSDALVKLTLPDGNGHVYVNGEVSLVASLQATLQAKGLTAEQISAKGYWRRGLANGFHGEPERM